MPNHLVAKSKVNPTLCAEGAVKLAEKLGRSAHGSAVEKKNEYVLV
jgi:hypothetical protein